MLEKLLSAFEELELVDLGVPIKILPRNLAPISEMFGDTFVWPDM